MDIKLLEEPLLQFGKGEYICPRTGIYKYNVSDINDIRPDKIVIGFIGLSESINIAISWIKKCRNHIESKKSKQPNLFTNFPGFNETIAFRSEVVYDESYIRKINNSALDQIKREANDIDQLIIKTVDLYLAEIHFLANNKKPDVILCVLDESLTKIIYGTKTIEIDDDFNEEDPVEIEVNFRRLLKAKAMEYNIPIQIFRDRIAKPSSEMQDEASIAWNFYTALYYKAGGIPWSLKKESSNITCFAGISFYRTRDKKTIQTSVAQIFNEHGNGVILRGTPVKEDKKESYSVINQMMLRAMAKAKYSEKNLGHYGLAMDYYCHFTSPIRRYPDLMVHRLIKTLIIHPENFEEKYAHYTDIVHDISVKSSVKEREAIDCEREVMDMLMASYMEERIGEEFEGTIDSITKFGMFVLLDNGVEGLIHISNLDGYFNFNEANMTLESAAKTYHIGDKVSVININASKKQRKIDFILKEDYDKITGVTDAK